MKRIIFCLCAMIFAKNVHSQKLLNWDEKTINSYVKNQNGILEKRRFTHDLITGIDGIQLTFHFPPTLIKQNGLFIMIFYFSKEGRCTHYTAWYNSEKFMRTLISENDNPKSSFKRIDKELAWTSKSDPNIKMVISPGNFGKKYSIFMLDIRNR